MNSARTLALISLALLLAGTVPAVTGARPVQSSAPPGSSQVPTHICGCQSTIQGESATLASFRLASAVAGTPTYDEQLGATFTQSFTSMAYNVTAVEQTDPTSGEGPAYLLNGLTGSGYWYQVGLSWNWNPGSDPGTGFAMSYEVFNPQQQSIFPTDGNGGLLSFSGSVNQGDSMLLNLYFSSGDVMMVAHDWNTGASASESFSAESATSFQGDAQAVANSNGFFTGLMTEWYHPQEYLSNEKEVLYLETALGISSAWLWMDEYNPSGRGHSVFSNETASPISFTSDPSKLQEFASNGATEYIDANEFVTGAKNATATVPLKVSYFVSRGGSGYSAPVFEYISEGEEVNATLTSSATTYEVDTGSAWNVTATLAGSSPTERWVAGQAPSGVATSAQTLDLIYYHQYLMSVEYSLVGAEGTAPDFVYTALGRANSAVVSTSSSSVWADAGTPYSMSDPFSGSNALVRWASSAPTSGTVTSSTSIAPTYYQQFAVPISYSVSQGGTIGASQPPTIAGVAFGNSTTETLALNPTSLWLDAGSQYAVTSQVNGSSQPLTERWVTNSSSGTVTIGLKIDPQYQNQYLVTLQPSSTAGGTVSTTGGWVDAGSPVQAMASANAGWKLEYWATGATTSGREVANGPALSIVVNGPVNDTALFYAGLTISTGAGVSASYSYQEVNSGSVQGTVAQGSSATIYVPPGTVDLQAGSASFPYAFTGWSGALTSSGPSVSLSVSGPESVSAVSTYNVLDIAIILGAVIILVVVVAALAGRGRRKTAGSPAA